MVRGLGRRIRVEARSVSAAGRSVSAAALLLRPAADQRAKAPGDESAGRCPKVLPQNVIDEEVGRAVDPHQEVARVDDELDGPVDGRVVRVARFRGRVLK